MFRRPSKVRRSKMLELLRGEKIEKFAKSTILLVEWLEWLSGSSGSMVTKLA